MTLSVGLFDFIEFELEKFKGSTTFDNVIITDDTDEADAIAEKWKTLNEHEYAQKKSHFWLKDEDELIKTEADKKSVGTGVFSKASSVETGTVASNPNSSSDDFQAGGQTRSKNRDVNLEKSFFDSCGYPED